MNCGRLVIIKLKWGIFVLWQVSNEFMTDIFRICRILQARKGNRIGQELYVQACVFAVLYEIYDVFV